MKAHLPPPSSSRRKPWISLLLLLVSLLAGACSQKLDEETLSYRKFLAISQVNAYYNTEPQTRKKYPIVKGSLTNMGSHKLEVVELTLNFKDNLGNVIFVDHGFPVFISSYSTTPVGQQYLFPGQRISFAFKSVSCPPTWQQGRVEIEITKVVISRNS